MEDYQDWRWEPEARVIALSGALAAAGISYDFPGVVKFRVLGVSFQMVTAAAGAARQAIVSLEDSTGAVVFSVAAPATQAGGLTVVYSFSGWTPAAGSGALGRVVGPFIDATIAENLTLTVAVSGTSPADAISNARVLVKQWPRDVGYPALAPAAA